MAPYVRVRVRLGLGLGFHPKSKLTRNFPGPMYEFRIFVNA